MEINTLLHFMASCIVCISHMCVCVCVGWGVVGHQIENKKPPYKSWYCSHENPLHKYSHYNATLDIYISDR